MPFDILKLGFYIFDTAFLEVFFYDNAYLLCYVT